jgi:biofilm PGA synthesis N-glycosyltransferase PgaC
MFANREIMQKEVTHVAETVFWTAFLYTAYVYIGYPVLLVAWRKLFPWPVCKRYQEPSVSIVIAMHDESHHVHSRLRNCLELDYPADRLQVIVSLDAPTDDTVELVQSYADRNVDIVYSPVRRGKAAALNAGIAKATGEIILFADARQRFEKGIVREMVANFADESVGAVSGELLILDAGGRESAYWRYEKMIRALESDIHSLPGATGAIYAIRRELFRPVPSKTVLDDVVIPMRIVLQGKRSIFDAAARAYDTASETPEQEFKRKRRTLAGNYQLLFEMPELLSPWRNPISIQFCSHKIGRLFVPYCLAAFFVSNLFLHNPFYLMVLASQALWYGAACAGLILSKYDLRDPAFPNQARRNEP